MSRSEINPPPPADLLEHFPRLKRREDHPSGWEFPDYLANPDCRWLFALRELYTQPITFPASLSPQAGMLIHSLVRNLRPRVIIEVGMFCSISTHWMASALLENGCTPGVDAVIHCFDDFAPITKGPWRDDEMPEGRQEFVTDRLTKAGLIDFVRLHPGDSSTNITNAYDELRDLGGVDLAFIDGDHTIPGAVADFVTTETVLNTGGYVILHDTFPNQCGGHKGPRHILDHVRTTRPDPARASGRITLGRGQAEAPDPQPQAVGEGLYDRIDVYLGPVNYGLGLLRRLA
jgi:predicted O-methyltransferase YrrM